MRKLWIIPFCLLLCTCETEETPLPERNIPDEIQPLLDQFLLEAERRGVALDISKLSFEYEFGLTSPDQTVVVASCTRSEELHLVKIDTSNTYWVFGGAMGHEEVIFHELGHCLLERPHLEEELPTGDFKSIMRAQGPLSYGILNTFVQASLVHRRDYYISELFNPDIDVPCWADSLVESPFPLQVFDEDFINQGSRCRMTLDDLDNLWVCSLNQLYHFQDGNFQLVPIAYDIKAVTPAGEGGLWVAANNNGLGLIGLWKDHQFTTFFEDSQMGGPMSNLLSLLLDQNGVLWFGTRDGRIFVQDEAGDFQEIPGQSESAVFRIMSSPDGTIYILKGVEVLIFKDSLTPQKLSSSNSNLPTGFIRDLAIDTNGTIWLVVDGFDQTYLLQYDNDSGAKILNLTQVNIPETFVNAVRADSQGDIWIATSNGLRKWENGYFSNYCKYNTANPVFSFSDMVIDSQQNVWSLGKDPLDSRRKITLTQTGF